MSAPMGRDVRGLALAQGAQATAGAMFSAGLVFAGADDGDGLGLALNLLLRTLPTMLLAFVGGALADRWPRKRIAGIAVAVIAASYGVGALLVGPYGLGWPVQILSLVGGFASALGAPALYALLPSLVERDGIVHANGLVRTCRNAGSILGPLAAAAIANAWSVSLLWACAAVVELLAAAMLVGLRVPPVMHADDGDDGEDSDDGGMLADLAAIPGVFARYRWLAVGVAFWAVYLAVQAGAADVTMPLAVAGGHGKTLWSVMTAVMSVGYVSGSLIVLRSHIHRWLLTGSVLWSVLAAVQLLVVGVCGSTVAWIVASFLAGLGLEISGALWGSVLQSRVSQAYMGRVSSIDYAFSFGCIPVGYAVYGLFDQTAWHMVLTVSAVVMAVAAAYVVPFLVAEDRKAQA